MRNFRRSVGAAAVLLLLATGCAQGEPAASPPATTGTAAAAVHVAIIGDSLADAGWPARFGERLAERLGRPVDVEVLTAMGVPEGAALVADAPASLARADVVIVQTGFNNAVPDPETGIGCAGSVGKGTSDDILRWIRTTEPTCLAEGVTTYAGLYDRIFAGAKDLRDGKPTVFVAMTTVDGNNDPTLPDSLVGMMPPQAQAEVETWTLAAYGRWNSMLGARAAASGFQVVDLYRAVNGPDGRGVVGALSDDGRHPNAQGDEVYVRELEAVDVSALNT